MAYPSGFRRVTDGVLVTGRIRHFHFPRTSGRGLHTIEDPEGGVTTMTYDSGGGLDPLW
jgi:hypothetical protein